MTVKESNMAGIPELTSSLVGKFTEPLSFCVPIIMQQTREVRNTNGDATMPRRSAAEQVHRHGPRVNYSRSCVWLQSMPAFNWKVDMGTLLMGSDQREDAEEGRDVTIRHASRATESPLARRVTWSGTLTARLLPQEKMQDARSKATKARDRMLSAKNVRQSGEVDSVGVPWGEVPFTNRAFTKHDLFDNEVDLFTHGGDLDDSMLVTSLDLTFFRPPDSGMGKSTDVGDGAPQAKSDPVRMCMTRDPTESPARTLKRMELSTAKRIRETLAKEERLRREQEKTQQQTQEISGKKKTQVGENRRRRKMIRKESSTQSSSQSALGDETSVVVTLEGEILDTSTIPTNGDLWRLACEGMDKNSGDKGATMEIFFPDQDLRLTVVPLPPTILKVHTFEAFEADLYVGVPQVIECDLIYAETYIVVWYADGAMVEPKRNCYVPHAKDVGKTLKVEVIPVRHGIAYKEDGEIRVFSKKVEELPRMPIVRPIREDFISKPRGSDVPIEKSGQGGTNQHADSIRVVSYNLLADIYTSRELEKRDQFAYTEIPFLLRTRRMPMIVAELLAYNAELICLQEVDELVYDSLLRPVLASAGYKGYFSTKINEQKEGCALFWSTDCFDLLEEADMGTYAIGDLFDSKGTDGWDSMREIQALVENHSQLRDVIREKIGQVLQVVQLTWKPKMSSCSQERRPVVVANTHLFYHPMAGHIRAMQAFVVCRKIDEIRRRNVGSCPAPFILSGDLNSVPQSGAVELLSKGLLAPKHECWEHLNRYRWEMGDQTFFEEDEKTNTTHFKMEECLNSAEYRKSRIPPPTLKFPSTFPSLIFGCEQVPEFTNFVPGFIETLDYVLASKPSRKDQIGFVSMTSAPFPSKADVEPYYAMPNEFMPSDHVSIVCDLEWKKHGSKGNGKKEKSRKYRALSPWRRRS